MRQARFQAFQPAYQLQETADRIRDASKEEARIIVEEAKNNANSIVHEALVKAERIEHDSMIFEKNNNFFNFFIFIPSLSFLFNFIITFKMFQVL